MNIFSWFKKATLTTEEAVKPKEQAKGIIENTVTKINKNPHKNEKMTLSSVEISLLSHIHCKSTSKLILPGYWEHDYNLNTKATISKFLKYGYLTITTYAENTDKIKATDLKILLKKHGLKVSGKRAELLQRVLENVPHNQFVDFFSKIEERFYTLTTKGEKIALNYPWSITRDLEFEDTCLDFIKKQDLNNAYITVCKWEAKKKSPRGFGINWTNEAKIGISQNELKKYLHLLGVDLGGISDDIAQLLKETVILYRMLGIPPNQLLFNRIYKGSIADLTPQINILNYEFRKISSLIEIDDWKMQSKSTLRQYNILVPQDEQACETCKTFENKTFHIDDAIVGTNFPPFHLGCRCSVVTDMSYKRKL